MRIVASMELMLRSSRNLFRGTQKTKLSSGVGNDSSRTVSVLKVGEVSVELRRKKIKNVHLRVYPPNGAVRISAPLGLPISTITDIVEKRLEWIRAQQVQASSGIEHSRYLSGERHLFCGSVFKLNVFNTSGRPSVRVCDPDVIEMQVPLGYTDLQRGKLLDDWYRAQIKAIAQPYFDKWEAAMGVKASQWRIKKMKTRWGSCNVSDARIWLSLELAKKPSRCIEYVVVHELAHLIEHGHGPRFTQVMDKFLPEWKVIRRELNTSQVC